MKAKVVILSSKEQLVERAILATFKVKITDVRSSSRDRHLVAIRQTWARLLYEYTNLKNCQIGTIVERDHASVSGYINQHDERLKYVTQYNNVYYLVKESYIGLITSKQYTGKAAQVYCNEIQYPQLTLAPFERATQVVYRESARTLSA